MEKNISVQLSDELVKRVEEHIITNKSLSYFYDHDYPVSIEEVIKDALFVYLDRFEKLSDLTKLPEDLNSKDKIKNSIKDLLKKRKLTQRELCKLTNIDEGNMTNILKNKVQPSLDAFIRIWVSLGCPPIEDILYRE